MGFSFNSVSFVVTVNVQLPNCFECFSKQKEKMWSDISARILE